MGAVGSLSFIHADILSPFADFIEASGGIVDLPFSRAGIPIELAGAKDQIISTADYLSLLEQGALEIQNEYFGLALGECVTLRQLGSFGCLVAAAPTLGASIKTVNELVPHYSSAARCWLEVQEGMAYWRYRLGGRRSLTFSAHREGRRFDGELALILFRNLIRLAAGDLWQPQEMLFDGQTVRDVEELQSRVGAACGHSSGSYALVFPSDMLALPMTYSPRLIETERQTRLERLIVLDPGESFVAMLMAIVRAQLHGGYPEIAAVARSSGLSVRTLQRRLSQEGWTFSRLVTAVRQKAACELLSDPEREQIQVSLSLGYSDTANFSRAFKKWTGITPSAYRHARL